MDYKVIPNFLNKEEFFLLQKEVIEKVPLFYQNSMAYKSDTSSFYFSTLLYDEFRKPNISPEHFKIITPLFYHGKVQFPFHCKVNCFVKQEKHIFTEPHIDTDVPHNVLLHSINSNNGYTILDPKDKNIKVPSIANQALFFNGNIEHQAVTQTDENVRFNININFH